MRLDLQCEWQDTCELNKTCNLEEVVSNTVAPLSLKPYELNWEKIIVLF